MNKAQSGVWIGPRPTAMQISAIVFVGTIGILIPGVQPIVLGALLAQRTSACRNWGRPPRSNCSPWVWPPRWGALFCLRGGCEPSASAPVWCWRLATISRRSPRRETITALRAHNGRRGRCSNRRDGMHDCALGCSGALGGNLFERPNSRSVHLCRRHDRMDRSESRRSRRLWHVGHRRLRLCDGLTRLTQRVCCPAKGAVREEPLRDAAAEGSCRACLRFSRADVHRQHLGLLRSHCPSSGLVVPHFRHRGIHFVGISGARRHSCHAVGRPFAVVSRICDLRGRGFRNDRVCSARIPPRRYFSLTRRYSGSFGCSSCRFSCR